MPASDNGRVQASIYQLRAGDLLVLIVLTLVGLGALMVSSASMQVDAEATAAMVDQVRGSVTDAEAAPAPAPSPFAWRWSETGLRHVEYAAYALLAFFVIAYAVNPSRLVRAGPVWQQPAVWAMVVAIALSALVLIPGIGIETNGARRWLPIGSMQLQPSELAKWAVVLYLAYLFAARPFALDRFVRGFVPAVAPVALLCLLIVLEDFGSAALIGAASLLVLLVAKARPWHLAVTVPPAMGAAIVFMVAEPYRRTRMTSFLDPFADPEGSGYHMVQSLLSFSTGGLSGRGLGGGVQKLGYLPEDTTDFIFAVVCEEMGVFGAAAVVSLYIGLLAVCWHVLRRERDAFFRLVIFGLAAMIGLQATINMAVATVSVPTKGLSLPLISAGGSGLVFTCAAIGLLVGITRRQRDRQTIATFDTPEPPERAKKTREPARRRSRFDRRRARDEMAVSTSSLVVGGLWGRE